MSTEAPTTPNQIEVLESLQDFVGENLLLLPVGAAWQPTDYLPDLQREDWVEQVRAFREPAKSIPDDVLVVLVAGMITEEALPNYSIALNLLARDYDGSSPKPWAVWSRGWTAEENRHGDLLNAYLRLTGRVDMRAVEVTVHHLLSGGFEPRAYPDLYGGLVYTAFQERATKIAHINTGRLAEENGETALGKICAKIAGDEARHEAFYTRVMGKIFEIDPEGALATARSMLRRVIAMPGRRMFDGKDPDLFEHFAAVGQRIGVYTVRDYASIIDHLVKTWNIAALKVSGKAARAQEYLCGLAATYEKLADEAAHRLALAKVAFSWIGGREVQVCSNALIAHRKGFVFIRAMRIRFFLALVILFAARSVRADSDPLEVGIAGHAFDHLSEFSDQAQTAAASGATIIYSTGFGSLGYEGLPNEAGLQKTHDSTSAYLLQAKAKGIRLAIGYVCATSIVKVETFDKNWSAEFRAQFATPPSAWMQQDKEGKALPSWYGGDYHPACMNNPDWRTYEKFMVRQQLEAGHDGIFFDNPTVHPQGCYCEYCLKKFGKFLENEGAKVDWPAGDVGAMRRLAVSRPKDFLRFRATIASDFLAEIRQYARTIKPGALITCNNSLNSPEVLFSQCQTYGYNIYEMSKVEDLVVVEDMGTQPRVLANGAAVEYGPVYEVLQSISHGKPIVAVTLAEADYHTPANLMRLAMAEAAAHGASYLSWPTWAVNQRERMVAGVRPEADFLKEHSELLNEMEPEADVLLFFPHRRWIESTDCPALAAARAMGGANVQFRVVCEEDLGKAIGVHAPEVLVAESAGVLNEGEAKLIEDYQLGGGQVVWSADADWLNKVQGLLARPVIEVEGSPNVRAVVRRKGNQTIVHLLNLNVQRVSSYEDRVSSALDVRVKIRVGATSPKSVQALTADAEATHGAVVFKLNKDGDGAVVDVTVPRVNISTILVIE